MNNGVEWTIFQSNLCCLLSDQGSRDRSREWVAKVVGIEGHRRRAVHVREFSLGVDGRMDRLQEGRSLLGLLDILGRLTDIDGDSRNLVEALFSQEGNTDSRIETAAIDYKCSFHNSNPLDRGSPNPL